MKLQKSIIAIFALFIFALTANAQFGDLIQKAKDKVDKTTKKVPGTNVNTNGGQVSGQTGDESLRWDLALRNTNFTNSVNEGAMKQLIKNGMDGDYGKGGLLVFTKQPFGKKSATISDTVLRLSGGDSIYMTAFFADQFGSNDLDKNLELDIKIISVGDVKYAQTGYMADAMTINYGFYKGAATAVLPLDFLPNSGKSAKYQTQVGDIARTLRKLPKGVHIVQLRLFSNMNGANAVGAFYYDNSAGGGDAAINETLKAVTMPAPVKRDAALEKGIVDLLNGMGGGVALRVVITDRDWIPLRHEITGVLIGRIINTVVGIKLDDGTCFRENQSYAQDYNGRTYTGLRLNGTRLREDMACENLKPKL